MKKILFTSTFLLLIGIGFGLYFSPQVVAGIKKQLWGSDPDLPDFAAFKVNKEEFMINRVENIGMKRGIFKDIPFYPQDRINAVTELDRQQEELRRMLVPQTAWTEIGPAPIPLGQTDTSRVDVSGRVTAIAIHPTNADIVYVGTAQGGIYRTTDGGTNWTPIFDGAMSIAIGAISIAPSQPETIYVGTGEPNFAVDAFYGVGIYRIDNASTTATLSGPFGGTEFAGRAVSEIIVHPTVPATIFASSTSGAGGTFQSGATPTTATRGLFRSTNATGVTPTFTKLAVAAALPDDFSIRDIAIDPLDPNILIANVVATNGGIYRTTNALGVTPTFTNVLTFTLSGTSRQTAEFASHHANAAGSAVFYAATGFDTTLVGGSGGRVYRSIDAGATWVLREDNNFCGGQCFYNLAVAVQPVDTNPDNDRVYIGGQTNPMFAVSTNGADTFTNSQGTLHADTHVITVAPSNPTIVFHGNDGGVWKSTNSGTTWAELNNAQFSATQFISMDVHPTDINFALGGTQDNGTNLQNTTWSHADDGDGGQSLIDQNATNTTTVTMYHTFFNQTNAMGYGRVLLTANANPVGWTYFGCGFGGFTANGMTCTATATLFYAPMERGPGNPNTLYFGSDVLYRSANSGTTMTKISQEPIASGSAISSIGISPQNDNVRIVGLTNGGIFGTGITPGTTTLQNLDPTNVVPNNFIARTVIDPLDQNTAYVTLSAYNVVNVWKTTTLSSFADTGNIAPTWTAAATGLPQVPVNAFMVDPVNSNRLYAGTDIGVYASNNGGATWGPYGTGLPRVAVFDIAMTAGTLATRQVKIATHGRGMWQIPALTPTAANVSVSGRIVTREGNGIRNAVVNIIGQDGVQKRAITGSLGYYTVEDVPSGQSYTFSISSKRYTFTPSVVSVTDSIVGLDFVADGVKGRILPR